MGGPTGFTPEDAESLATGIARQATDDWHIDLRVQENNMLAYTPRGRR
jgi:hypothetical protein